MSNNKVIVVEDDPSVLRGVARLLKTSGFDPVLFDSAESCEDACDIADACCMILDIDLKGRSGVELKQTLGSDLPVIFITASDSEAISIAAHASGCIAFLRKPFSAQSLIEPIRRLSEASGAATPKI